MQEVLKLLPDQQQAVEFLTRVLDGIIAHGAAFTIMSATRKRDDARVSLLCVYVRSGDSNAMPAPIAELLIDYERLKTEYRPLGAYGQWEFPPVRHNPDSHQDLKQRSSVASRGPGFSEARPEAILTRRNRRESN